MSPASVNGPMTLAALSHKRAPRRNCIGTGSVGLPITGARARGETRGRSGREDAFDDDALLAEAELKVRRQPFAQHQPQHLSRGRSRVRVLSARGPLNQAESGDHCALTLAKSHSLHCI